MAMMRCYKSICNCSDFLSGSKPMNDIDASYDGKVSESNLNTTNTEGGYQSNTSNGNSSR